MLIGVSVEAAAKLMNKMGVRPHAVTLSGQNILRYHVRSYMFLKHPPSKFYPFGKKHEKSLGEKLVNLALKMKKRHPEIEYVLPLGGVGENIDALKTLWKHFKVIGNKPRVVARARDFNWLRKKSAELGFIDMNSKEIKMKNIDDVVDEIGIPFIVRRHASSGGRGIFKVFDAMSLEEVKRLIPPNEKITVEEYIEGIPGSINFISNGEEISLVTTTQQYHGIHFLHAPDEFKWCGNIMPSPIPRRVINNFIELARELKLKGLFGFDFMRTKDGYYVLECNTRPPGTINLISKLYNVNMLEHHVRAILNGEVFYYPHPRKIGAILNYFAPTDGRVPSINDPEISMQELPGTKFTTGEKIATFYLIRNSETEIISDAMIKAKMLDKKIHETKKRKITTLLSNLLFGIPQRNKQSLLNNKENINLSISSIDESHETPAL